MGLCFSNYENSVYETVLQIDDEILTPPPSTFPYAPHESESESENENENENENSDSRRACHSHPRQRFRGAKPLGLPNPSDSSPRGFQ